MRERERGEREIDRERERERERERLKRDQAHNFITMGLKKETARV